LLNIKGINKTILKKYNFIDLFAGVGGFRLALESFGSKCVFSSENDKACQEVYKRNYQDTPEGDIKKISTNNIPNHDILCAGFPCQTFSISGKQRGFEDTRGTLFFDIIRITKDKQPELLFLENVKNFQKHNNGNTISVVKKTLEDIGYNVFYNILNSGMFEVPQKRERLYILAFRKDLVVKDFKFPKQEGKPTKLKDILLPDKLTEDYVIKRSDITLKEKVVVQIDMQGNYPQLPIRIGQVNKGGQGERIYHECGHAITLSAYGGGVGAKTGLYLINGRIRKLASRECARLMGFPDNFFIHHSDHQAYKQFGNSVVVNVLQAILKEVIKEGIFSV